MWVHIQIRPKKSLEDVELGCGGVIGKYSKTSVNMQYLVVSPALEDPRNKDILNELHESAKNLGLKRRNITVWKYPRRVLHEHRNDVRQDLIRIVGELNPDVIFTTTSGDLHPDHALVGEEVLRLFRDKNILGYEVISSSLNFTPNLFIELDEESLNRKIESLLKYKSQLHRHYFKPDVIRSLARMRGAQAKMPHAEAFRVLRLIMK